ncbi:hypothetical protein BDN70DRAFT_920174 [Pholiota conissans]|uniref:Uncharacterized protein n=1 Tax=Pholiota conissans TaxID=109636 RepID=A0A9P5Z6D9_9AGAR|nr:hypothetical protein BDN70DRAFT_920174 [Pholiota conissans]
MPAPRKQMDDGWAFDFLTSMHCADSDDSDQEDGSIPSALPVVTEAKLLKDMDLSTREETVVYKPNPFSIAKMNAAYRTQAPIKKTVAPPNAALPTTKSGQKTLAEGFALQKQKTKPLPSRPVPMPFRVKPPAKVFSMKEERPSENSVPLHASSPLKASQMVPHNALQERFSEQSPNGQQKNAQFGYYTENYSSKSNPLSFSSPIAPPARPINTNPNRDHDTPAAYFSSPLKSQPSYDPRMQAPSRPQPINNFRPRLPAKFQPPSRHVFRKEISLLKFPNTNSIGRAVVGPPTPNVPFKYEEIVNPDLHLRFTEGINKFEAIDRADLDLYPNETVVHPMAPRRQEPFEQPATILPPASEVSIFPTESRVKARPKRDAYHFSAEDPDEEWSTLPSRKKTKQRCCRYLSTLRPHIQADAAA